METEILTHPWILKHYLIPLKSLSHKMQKKKKVIHSEKALFGLSFYALPGIKKQVFIPFFLF